MSECHKTDPLDRIYWKIFQCKMFHRKIIQSEKYPRTKFLADRSGNVLLGIFLCATFFFLETFHLEVIFDWYFSHGVFSHVENFSVGYFSKDPFCHYVAIDILWSRHYVLFEITSLLTFQIVVIEDFCHFWFFFSLFDIVTPNPIRRPFLNVSVLLNFKTSQNGIPVEMLWHKRLSARGELLCKFSW